MEKIIFLKSVFDDTKIWGGKKLKKYGYEGKSKKIGEAYLISGLKNNSSIILNENINEKNLRDFYINNKKWFNNYKTSEYPLLSKIIDAKDDLSIQVHPNDEYAIKNYNKFGKTECWYILDCKKNSDIVYGLKNINKIDELNECIVNNQWDLILNKEKIKKEDVLYIPAGTVHAIKKNTFLFEIQQSSDLTFRLYDYDRIDENGNKRELHIKQSLDVIDINQNHQITIVDNNVMIDCDYFKTEIYKINKEQDFIYNNVFWIELVILEGKKCFLNGVEMQKGISAIIKENTNFTISGKVKIAITYIQKNN